MEYLKVNCYELAEINSDIRQIARQANQIFLAYETILSSLRREEGLKEIISREDLLNQEAVQQMSVLEKQLDCIVDIYYEMEMEVKAQNNLLLIFCNDKSHSMPIIQKYEFAAIQSNQLIVDDWLRERLFKNP